MNPCEVKIIDPDWLCRNRGFLASVWRNEPRMTLFSGDGRQFPAITVIGGFYFVDIVDACDGHCITVKVLGKDGDELLVEPIQGSPCFAANSKVTYHRGTQYIRALVEQVGINAKDPLVYDCATRTLSVDCHKLASDPSCGCGGVGAPGAGAKGEKGDKGDTGTAGVGIAGVRLGNNNELYVTLTNGRVVEAGVIPTVKGDKGEDGKPGRDGIDGVTPNVREVERVWMEESTTPGQYKIMVSYSGEFSGVGQQVGMFDVPAIRSTLPQEMTAIRNDITGVSNRVGSLETTSRDLNDRIAGLSTQLATLQGTVAAIQEQLKAKP